MRKSTSVFAAVTCALFASAVPCAKGTVLTPNSTVAPNAQPDPFVGTSLVASTGIESFNLSLNGSTMSGVVQEYVFTNFSGNIFGSSNLTFVITVTLTGGTTVSGGSALLERIADSGFATVNTDVGYRGIAVTGVWNPASADRSSGGDEIAFNFLPPSAYIGVGDSSSYLIINTNATNYAPSALSLQGTLATSLGGFSGTSTPEPATLSFCGVGLGLLATRRRRAATV